MKILLIADRENDVLWEHWDQFGPQLMEGVDMILSAGDLSPLYLEYLVTLANVPLLYVRGNHDGYYDEHPPEGCVNIDDTVYECKGLRIAGLGGSMRYRRGADMYTEREMRGKVRRLRRRLRRLAIRDSFFADRRGGSDSISLNDRKLDILLTHAPCRGYGDMEDLAHQGFECFNDLLEDYTPAVHCYGHVHPEYGREFTREMQHSSGTRLINGCGLYIFEVKTSLEE